MPPKREKQQPAPIFLLGISPEPRVFDVCEFSLSAGSVQPLATVSARASNPGNSPFFFWFLTSRWLADLAFKKKRKKKGKKEIRNPQSCCWYAGSQEIPNLHPGSGSTTSLSVWCCKWVVYTLTWRTSVCVRVCVLGSKDRFSLRDTTIPFQILHPESVFF